MASIDGALAERGLRPLESSEADACVGPPIAVTFRTLLERRGAGDADVAEWVASFRTRYRAVSLTATTAIPGIRAALAELAQTHRLVIVTSKAADLAKPIVRALRLDECVSAVFGPALDAFDETKTVTLRRALSTLNVTGGVMVGDRRHDIEAGHACGLAAVGVVWGSGTRRELLDAGADAIADHVTELAGIVCSFDPASR